MAQIFHRSTNTISRVSVFGGIGIIVVLVATLAAINRSSYVTEVGVARSQPVQFSHKHHVGDDGIDCRYCHTSVEESSFAGIPSTKICMNCHSQIWAESPILEPVRESFRTGKSLEWTRVTQFTGIRLFRSQHSCSQRRGLHHLPWARGSNAAHVARELLYIWSGVWSVTGIRSDLFGRGSRSSTWIGNHHRTRLLSGQKLVQEYKIAKLTSCSVCHR